MSVPSGSGLTSWAVSPYPWRESERLADALGLPLVAAMVLTGRGITDPAQARMFLDCSFPIPDPFLFAHMEAAVALLSEAVDKQRRVVIHGDYDADGITATALMVLGLRGLGLEAEWFLPNRFNEGYGLSRGAVEAIAAKGPGVLVTVDCGVNYPDEVALAKALGLDVVVVDHHQPGPRLPDCHLVHEVAGSYPNGDLCGVGLALKVMHGLYAHRGQADRTSLPGELARLLDLVAIGTIADLAPLRGENRYYVKEGLKLVSIGHRVGLRALVSVAACTGVVDSGTVAYRLAPRLNAAGRLADPSPPLRLLLTGDEAEAHALAARLHELNGARQDLEREILDQAVAIVETQGELPAVLVLAEASWHEGVVGIVASRLVERYHRPTILLGVRDGVAKGSGRSIGAYDLMQGLNACSAYLTVYGGHKQAAGLTLDAGRVAGFRQAIEDHAASCLGPGDLEPVYRADAILRPEDVSADTALALASLGPFGAGNPRPRVLLVDAALERAETTRNGLHLRCMVNVDGVKARGIGFGLGPSYAEDGQQPARRILGAHFQVDTWQGSVRPEFLLERIGASLGEKRTLEGGASNCRAEGAGGTPSEGRRQTTPPPEWTALLKLPTCRDFRDRRGRFSSVAQVLASGETCAILTCSAAWTEDTFAGRIPLAAIAGDMARLLRGGDGSAETSSWRTSLVEWEAAADVLKPHVGAGHVIAVDPPFRGEHVAMLREAARSGWLVHLVYGAEERLVTTRLLRYVVHPRFAMLCIYRAMQEGRGEESEVFTAAAAVAWREARVLLTTADLTRAAGVLADLGVQPGAGREAKLEARNISAYALAEADYEECAKFCQNL